MLCGAGRLLALVLFAGIAATASAATYFVSQSTGNDTNTGTIQALPWKTLSKVNSVNLQPGDSVLLKRGDVWRESLFVLRSGAQGNPLSFGAYGSGALPVIEGTDTLTSITSLGSNNYRVTTAAAPEVLVLNGVVGRRVANLGALSLQADWFPESGTSAVFRSSSAPASVDVTTRQFGIVMNQVRDVAFSNLHVRHAYDPVWVYNTQRVTLDLVQVESSAGYAGFFLSADAAGFGTLNTIDECIVTNQRGSAASLSFGNDGCGIFVYSTGLNDNNTFSNNLISNPGHEGIALLSTSNNLIANNSVSGSGSAGIRIAGPTSAGNVIERNESFENCNLQDDRFGIDLLDVSNDNVVRYNFVHEQGQVPGGEFKSGGIRFDGGDFSNSQNQTSTGNIAYYNVVFGEYIGINVFNASNVTIENNTVVDCSGYAITFNGVSLLVPLNNRAFNNVVRMLDEGLFFENGVAGSVIDYNVYQQGAGSFFVSAGAFHTWDTWRNQRGFDVHGKMGELGLVDPVTFDFRLTAASPAVNAGTDVGLGEDFNGTLVPQGGVVDAGAFEFIPGPAPTLSIGEPSATLTRTGPVDFVVTYSGATTVNLLAANVTLNKTGSANGTVSVLNGTTNTPTVRVSGVSGDGALSISIAAGTATDGTNTPALAAGPSSIVSVDNTAPTLSIGAPSASVTKAGPVDYTVTYSGANSVSLLSGNVTLNKTGSANGTVSVINGTTNTPTVRISSITGNGTLGISIAAATASDTAGNTAASAGPATTFTVDNTAPTLSIGAPSASVTKAGPVDYTVTYTGANSVSLLSGNVTLNKTGSANGTVSVINGTTNTPTVRISSITGNGTLGISIAAATASDTAGNTAASAGPATTFTVDNTAPTLSIGAPSASVTKAGPVDYVVTYSGANSVSLASGNVTLNKTGSANGTVSVINGTTNTPTVRISGITGDGTLGISIGSATASDTAGNTAAGAGPATTFTVDNTAPVIGIAAPSASVAKAGPVDFVVSYSGANSVSLSTGNVTLNKTGSANGTVNVLNGTTNSPTVRISGITGDGTLGISIAASTASDTAGNTAAGTGPTASFAVDNTAPTLSIGLPSQFVSAGGPVDYPVNYAGADAVTLLAGQVTLNTTGTAAGTVSVLNGTTASPVVRISGVSGDGTLGISIAAGSASDTAGNAAGGAGPASPFVVDNTAPALSIGAPSAGLTAAGPVDYPVSYTGGGTVNLTAQAVSLNTTGTAAGTVSVLNGGTANPTVRVSGITGDGTLSISIAAGTASDGAGNAAAGADAAESVTVDNTAPALSIGAPSVSLTAAGPVDYPVSYTGGGTVNLTAQAVSLNTTGTAAGTVSVLNGGTASPTVRVNGITGDGTLSISITAGTASDAAGNLAEAAGPGAAIVVDNTAPALSLGAPSALLTRGGPVDIPLTYTGAASVALLSGNVTLANSGTASAVVTVLNGGTASPTLRLEPISGDGEIVVSIAAGTASDAAGNLAGAAGPGAAIVVDNTAPALSIGAPSVGLTRGGPVDFPVSVSGADTVSVAADDVELIASGSATGTVSVLAGTTVNPTVRVSGITGDGALAVRVAAGAASDAAGNLSAQSAASAAAAVDNTAPGASVTRADAAVTNQDSVRWLVDFSEPVGGSFGLDDLNLGGTLAGAASITSITGPAEGEVYTVTAAPADPEADGSLSLSIGTGIADAAGNGFAGGSGAAYTLLNVGPGVSIGGPSAALTAGGPASFTISYTDAAVVSLAAGDIALNSSGTASGTVGVSGEGLAARTVTLSNITGDGALGISLAVDTARDNADNPAPGAGPSVTFTVDNSAPEAVISLLDAAVTNLDTVRWRVDFSETVGDSFAVADVALGGSLSAQAVVSAVTGPDAEYAYVVSATVDDAEADGTLSLVVNGVVEDLAGNDYAGGTGAAYTLDNSGPLVTIGAPSVALTRSGPVTFEITYAGADVITLSPGDVEVVRAGTANASVSVSGAGLAARTVTLSGVVGDGTLGIGIAPGTAADGAGNVASGATPGGTVAVDNTAPVAVVTQLDPSPTALDTLRWQVDFSEAVSPVLGTAHVAAGGTLPVGAAVVSGPAAGDVYVVSVSPLDADADGVVAIALIGTLSDAAGNVFAGGAGDPYVVAHETQEGQAEGVAEGVEEGVAEGVVEGSTEGIVEGLAEGSAEGIAEGNTEGGAEGVVEGGAEGLNEGTPEGSTEGGGEGIVEGVAEGVAEGVVEGEPTGPVHTADRNGDRVINLSELLRVIQLFAQGGLRCSTTAEDGFDSGVLPRDCTPHAADYNPQDWRIRLNELLRVIQLYNAERYVPSPGNEDGFALP
jgi:parallel beta-helix repeat protein